jgi:hypothetical protein
MNLTHKPSRERSSSFRLAYKLTIVLALAGYLSSAFGVHAMGRYSCGLSQNSNGTSVFVSCGSSAGNFLYVCSGGVCSESTGDFNQYAADQQCAQIDANGGCPETMYIE